MNERNDYFIYDYQPVPLFPKILYRKRLPDNLKKYRVGMLFIFLKVIAMLIMFFFLPILFLFPGGFRWADIPFIAEIVAILLLIIQVLKKELQRRKDRFNSLNNQFEIIQKKQNRHKAIIKYKNALRKYEYALSELEDLMDKLDDMPRKAMRSYNDTQCRLYLKQIKISAGDIPGLPLSKMKRLADNGIMTAADIDTEKITGFGVGAKFLVILWGWSFDLKKNFTCAQDRRAIALEKKRLEFDVLTKKNQGKDKIRAYDKILQELRTKTIASLPDYDSYFEQLRNELFQVEVRYRIFVKYLRSFTLIGR